MFVYKIGFKTLSVLKSSSARFEGNSVWETVNLCELILCKVEVTFSVVCRIVKELSFSAY